MPRYKVTAPDGKQYFVNAPDGATQEQVLAYAQAHYGTPEPPPGDGWQPGLARDIALGGRSTLQGIGGTLGLVTDPLAHLAGLPSAREGFGALADKLHLPKPQTAKERVIGDMGEAIAGTGVTMGVGGALRGGQVADKVGRFLTAQPGLQAVSAGTSAAASGITREAGGSPLEQIGAGLVGGILPSAASTTGSAAMRGLVRGRSGDQMRRTIADFASVGAQPSVAQASGNRVLQGAENLLGGAPTSAGVMGRFVERQADDIGAGLGRKADNLSRSASAERAGRAVESGVSAFAKDTKAKRAALYAAADQAIPPTVQSPLTKTRQALSELTALTPGAESTSASLINPRIATLAKTVNEDVMAAGGVPYAALKDLRSRVGEELSDFALDPSRPTKQYRRLYAALSQDMEEAARTQGPEAMRAAKRANDFMRVSADRLEQVERVVDKAGGPEKVYLAAMSGTKDGGTTLRAVMQSLPAEGQKAVTAAVIKRMGMATPGNQNAAGDAFSAATFLTNWNGISKEAKRALFDRYGLGFSRDVDRLARVADNIKSGAKVYANPSGTANRAAAMTYGASLVASLFDSSGLSLAGVVGGGVATNLAARYLTNPDAVRWLARATTAPQGAIPGIVSAMNAQAQKSGDQDLAELARLIQEADERKDR